MSDDGVLPMVIESERERMLEQERNRLLFRSGSAPMLSNEPPPQSPMPPMEPMEYSMGEKPMVVENPIVLTGASGKRYRVSDVPLGSGGYGAVYLGYDEKETKVAIKFYHETVLADSITREYELHHLLNEQKVHGICLLLEPPITTSKGTYTIMEYIDGKTLHHLIDSARTIKRTEGWPPEEALDMSRKFIDVMVQLTEIVARLHEECIVHYDIKPNNIMIVERGRRFEVMLLDLGMSCVQDKCRIDGQYQNLVCFRRESTYGYTAPETFFQNKFNYEYRKFDIYALGKVFADMAVGIISYERRPEQDQYILNLKPRAGQYFFQTNDRRLDELINSMVFAEWSKRPSSMDVLQALTNLEITTPFFIFKSDV